MYCHRELEGTYGPEQPSRKLWFSDTMTPRLDWTFDNFYASLSIRLWCIAGCRCPDSLDSTVQSDTTAVDEDEYDNTDRELQLKDGLTVIVQKDGSLKLVGANGMSTIVPNPQKSGVSRTCGADGKQFCPFQWPEDLYGPRFLQPPRPRRNGRPQPSPGPKLKQCGSNDRCQGPADCGDMSSIPEGSHCSCVIPQTSAQLAAAAARGEDPAFPQSVCGIMALALVGSISGKLNGYNYGNSLLNPRHVDSERGEGADEYDTTGLESAYPCVCNASYVSHACCDSTKGGIIWEDRSLKLGVLEL